MLIDHIVEMGTISNSPVYHPEHASPYVQPRSTTMTLTMNVITAITTESIATKSYRQTVQNDKPRGTSYSHSPTKTHAQLPVQRGTGRTQTQEILFVPSVIFPALHALQVEEGLRIPIATREPSGTIQTAELVRWSVRQVSGPVPPPKHVMYVM